MKCITLKPAWAWAVFHAGKDIENRTWETSYRGPLAIHASASIASADDDAEVIKRICGVDVPLDLQCGAVVGVVDLVDVAPDFRSRWYSPGLIGWKLAKPRACVPVDVKGKLGLWEFPEASIILDKP
jgi:hypothetical protein